MDRFQLVIVVSFEISDFFYYFSFFFFLGIEIHRVVGVHHTEEVEEWKKLEMNEEICKNDVRMFNWLKATCVNVCVMIFGYLLIFF